MAKSGQVGVGRVDIILQITNHTTPNSYVANAAYLVLYWYTTIIKLPLSKISRYVIILVLILK